MPLILTRGLGAIGDGSHNMSLLTEGYGGSSTPIYPACLAFQLLGVTITSTTITLTVSNTYTLVGPAADPTRYSLISSNGGVPSQITSLTQSGATLVLGITEQTNSKSYTLTIPELGWVDTNHNPFQGPFVVTYTAIGEKAELVLCRTIDARTIQVIYSKPVIASDAINPANYSISPTLSVVSGVMVTQQVYDLTTTRQTEGVTYSITSSNVRDLADNPD